MARIRTVKPEFFSHEQLASCSPHARLLAIALLQLADCEGRLRWIPMAVHGHAFPYEPDIDITACLVELESIGYARRYSDSEKIYLYIPTFKKHQRLSGDEASSASRLPTPPPENADETPDISPRSCTVLRDEAGTCFLTKTPPLRDELLGNRKKEVGNRKEEIGKRKKILDASASACRAEAATDPLFCQNAPESPEIDSNASDPRPGVIPLPAPSERVSGPATSAQRVSSESIERVIDHYRKYHPRSVPGKKERDLISRRLKEGRRVEDLCEAIDGCHVSPYHCGENDRGQVYQSLELIIRDAKHVDQFIEALATSRRPVLSKETQQSLRAGSSWVERMSAKLQAGETEATVLESG